VKMIVAAVLCIMLAAPSVSSALGFRLLTAHKDARFINGPDPLNRFGFVRVGRDHALLPLVSPACPTVSSVDLESYPQATARVIRQLRSQLDCTKWFPVKHGWAYRNPLGPVRAIHYASAGMRIDFAGPSVDLQGPVGYLQAQLTIGSTRYRARFHNFRRNDPFLIRARRPSQAAAAGEAGFWDVLTGDNHSEAYTQQTIAYLQDAAQHSPQDGWSRFLLAMLHLYRFGQVTVGYTNIDPQAVADLDAANASFTQALPLLWDGAHGDSRVPGFAAAAEYMQGVVHRDSTLRARGLADLAQALSVNALFNVFDYIPVIQAVAPGDPEFATAFGVAASYISDPSTFACVATQPEICANDGFAPHNIQGALTLFGDVFAKGGDLDGAKRYYTLASELAGGSDWGFAAILQPRLANTAARVAAYEDNDPTNDPPIIGAGPEACAVCHVR